MLAIGLMSGTSLDGIDAALIETDGENRIRPVAFHGVPLPDGARAQLFDATRLALTLDRPCDHHIISQASALITRLHADAVTTLLTDANVDRRSVQILGFHGQTIAHRPDRGWTWQIGDGAELARSTGIATVHDFRSADVAAGGQGAPLLPIYHAARTAELARPLAVLNLGGVGNLTWIGSTGDLIAFDTGPANGLVDAWVESKTGQRFDVNGALASSGAVDMTVLTAVLDHPFFDQAAPKSLDRNDFTIQPARGLSPADGAATLTAFTAETVALALNQLPDRPQRLLVSGGGRRNSAMMRMIADRAGLNPEPVDDLGWNGDAIEAEGFAYMAVRHLKGLPISFPGTTGVTRAMVGGVLSQPEE